MAEEKPKGFLGRMFNRLRGKEEQPETPGVTAPEAAIEEAAPKREKKRTKPEAKTPAKPKAPVKAKAKTPAKPKAAAKKETAKEPTAKAALEVTAEIAKPPKAKTEPKAKKPAPAKPKVKKPKVEAPKVKKPVAAPVAEAVPAPEIESAPVPTPPVTEPPAVTEPPVPPAPPKITEVISPEPEPAPEPEPTPEPEPEEPTKKKGWFARLKSGLSRSSNQLKENITSVFTKRKLDEDTLQDLEDVLIQADLGVETAMNITEALAKDRHNKEVTDREVREILSAEVAKVLAPVAQPLEISGIHKPHIILVVGVNGTGKTTTIGKFAAKFRDEGKSVMLAAGDTFRAAAIAQLKIWGERVGAPVISGKEGADSSGLAYDAITAAREQNVDILMIDTAGRLQNQTDLMAELEKLVRVIGKQ
ncbi:MAG: signal recognition particle-docking protein FtsY, partial [Rhizobiales bacterium]|nr:signal recognition particle-docking protein FtsY [Hyphomicrobiales bacterium]